MVAEVMDHLRVSRESITESRLPRLAFFSRTGHHLSSPCAGWPVNVCNMIDRYANSLEGYSSSVGRLLGEIVHKTLMIERHGQFGDVALGRLQWASWATIRMI